LVHELVDVYRNVGNITLNQGVTFKQLRRHYLMLQRASRTCLLAGFVGFLQKTLLCSATCDPISVAAVIVAG